MPAYINIVISGVPYAKDKTRGDVDAPIRWTKSIIDNTRNLPSINGPCTLRVTFLMPPNKYPADFPYGPDIDNYLKRFLDALNETIFAKAPGKDSCVIHIEASKVKVGSYEESGARLEIFEH